MFDLVVCAKHGSEYGGSCEARELEDAYADGSRATATLRPITTHILTTEPIISII
jgi:hypothetical protein